MAYGVIQHCLSLRCSVDFGVPDSDHPKHIAVPYEAADIPSKRSQYSHPDVSVILSFIAYYSKGLTYKQFQKTMQYFSKLSVSAKESNFKTWIYQLDQISRNKLKKQSYRQINIESINDLQQLFQAFRYNRTVIAFWLKNIIFQNDLRQFQNSITASSWDLTNFKQFIGFSGTKDSRWLFPYNTEWSPIQNPKIKGTDGKMLDLLIHYTKDISIIKQKKQKYAWECFCQQVILQEVDCVIDAGAILVGKSLKQDIVKWFANNKYIKKKFKGITFPDQNGHWLVFDLINFRLVERHTNIPEHQTFVIYDEARTRGADIKIGVDAIAAISLAPNMPKDKFIQAVGRLRKFGRNQNIKIFILPQISIKIPNFNQKDILLNKITSIICWIIQNSVNQNHKFMNQNNRLAWIHIKSLQSKSVYIQNFNSQLQKMYKSALNYQTPYAINRVLAKHQSALIMTQMIDLILDKNAIYGKCFTIKQAALNDICQREVEIYKQVEEQKQKQFQKLQPVLQKTSFKFLNNNILKDSIKYEFSNRWVISQNFHNCTSNGSMFGKYIFSKQKQNIIKTNQLMKVYFIMIQSQKLKLITLRDAQHLIATKQGSYYNPQSDSKIPICAIIRWDDLHFNSNIIKINKLHQQFCQVKFINGEQSYLKQKSSQKSEFQTLLRTFKQTRKVIRNDSKLLQMVSSFLNKRRNFNEKYYESALESMYICLINDKS